VTEDAAPPETPAPAPAKAGKRGRGPIAHAFAQNIHAILVGVFTLTSSVISALLGYYFAHEDRQNLMALEYDKLRAEHTLDIVKALTTAEAHMISVSVDGSYAQNAVCGLTQRIKTLAAQIAKAKPLAKLKDDPAYDLDAIEIHLKSPDIDAQARESWLFEHGMMKDELRSAEETVQARLKTYNDIARQLMGDTAATMRVYHRDRADAYMALTTSFLQLNMEAQTLMNAPACGAEGKWDVLSPKLLDWHGEAVKFSETLGIAIKPQ
jgi:hypothetical protein